MSTEGAFAEPSKLFFTEMITKDISLVDCILDLIDNSLDAAKKMRRDHVQNPKYYGLSVEVNLSNNQFDITDNCGGISLKSAMEDVFSFGRRKGVSTDPDSIGLYGIGLKRAVLKLGKRIFITSKAPSDDGFCVGWDVDKWLTRDSWRLPLKTPSKTLIPDHTTSIIVKHLHQNIADEMNTASFRSSIHRAISRTYSDFISNGISIFLNKSLVSAHIYSLKQSDDLTPYRLSYRDQSGVDVEVIAGMAEAPPDDTDAETPVANSEYYGWYVLCNDRAVVTADKSDLTVWGDDGFSVWHPQYNGFLGIVRFNASDTKQLPWTTTKRDVDRESSVYRRALTKMKEATREWLSYTNQRKNDLERAKEIESRAKTVPVAAVTSSQYSFPRLQRPTTPGPAQTNIAYAKPVSEVNKVKLALGGVDITNKQVGIATFEYFLRNEVE